MVMLLSGCGKSAALSAPKVEQGRLDLRTWHFETDGPVELRGEWKHRWGELLNPQTDVLAVDPTHPLYGVPGTWNQDPELRCNGQDTGHDFWLEVLLPPSQDLRPWHSDA